MASADECKTSSRLAGNGGDANNSSSNMAAGASMAPEAHEAQAQAQPHAPTQVHPHPHPQDPACEVQELDKGERARASARLQFRRRLTVPAGEGPPPDEAYADSSKRHLTAPSQDRVMAVRSQPIPFEADIPSRSQRGLGSTQGRRAAAPHPETPKEADAYDGRLSSTCEGSSSIEVRGRNWPLSNSAPSKGPFTYEQGRDRTRHSNTTTSNGVRESSYPQQYHEPPPDGEDRRSQPPNTSISQYQHSFPQTQGSASLPPNDALLKNPVLKGMLERDTESLIDASVAYGMRGNGAGSSLSVRSSMSTSSWQASEQYHGRRPSLPQTQGYALTDYGRYAVAATQMNAPALQASTYANSSRPFRQRQTNRGPSLTQAKQTPFGFTQKRSLLSLQGHANPLQSPADGSYPTKFRQPLPPQPFGNPTVAEGPRTVRGTRHFGLQQFTGQSRTPSELSFDSVNDQGVLERPYIPPHMSSASVGASAVAPPVSIMRPEPHSMRTFVAGFTNLSNFPDDAGLRFSASPIPITRQGVRPLTGTRVARRDTDSAHASYSRVEPHYYDGSEQFVIEDHGGSRSDQRLMAYDRQDFPNGHSQSRCSSIERSRMLGDDAPKNRNRAASRHSSMERSMHLDKTIRHDRGTALHLEDIQELQASPVSVRLLQAPVQNQSVTSPTIREDDTAGSGARYRLDDRQSQNHIASMEKLGLDHARYSSSRSNSRGVASSPSAVALNPSSPPGAGSVTGPTMTTDATCSGGDDDVSDILREYQHTAMPYSSAQPTELEMNDNLPNDTFKTAGSQAYSSSPKRPDTDARSIKSGQHTTAGISSIYAGSLSSNSSPPALSPIDLVRKPLPSQFTGPTGDKASVTGEAQPISTHRAGNTPLPTVQPKQSAIKIWAKNLSFKSRKGGRFNFRQKPVQRSGGSVEFSQIPEVSADAGEILAISPHARASIPEQTLPDEAMSNVRIVSPIASTAGLGSENESPPYPAANSNSPPRVWPEEVDSRTMEASPFTMSDLPAADLNRNISSLTRTRAGTSPVEPRKSLEIGQCDSRSTTSLCLPLETMSVNPGQVGGLDADTNGLQIGDATTTDLNFVFQRASKQKANYLPELKEESHEGSSLNTTASNLKTPMFNFAFSRQGPMRVSVDELPGKGCVSLKEVADGNVCSSLSHGLPPLRFSGIDLIKSFREALQRKSIDLMGDGGDHRMSPTISNQRGAILSKRVSSLIAGFEGLEGDYKKTGHTPRLSTVKRLFSSSETEEDIMAELESLTIPSVGGLTQRFSEWLPLYERLEAGELIAEDEIIENARKEIRSVGPVQKRSSARLRPIPGSPDMAVVQDNVFEKLTSRERRNLVLDTWSDRMIFSAGETTSLAELEAPSMTMLRARSLGHTGARPSIESELSRRKTLQSFAGTPTRTGMGPTLSGVQGQGEPRISDDFALRFNATSINFANSPRAGPSPLRDRVSWSGGGGGTPSSPEGEGEVISQPTTSLTSLSLSHLHHHHNNQHRHLTLQPHKAGERYPTTSLTPLAPFILEPATHSVLTFASENPNSVASRRGLMGFFGLRKAAATPEEREPLCPSSESASTEGQKVSAATARERRVTYREAEGMSAFQYHKERILKSVKKWKEEIKERCSTKKLPWDPIGSRRERFTRRLVIPKLPNTMKELEDRIREPFKDYRYDYRTKPQRIRDAIKTWFDRRLGRLTW